VVGIGQGYGEAVGTGKVTVAGLGTKLRSRVRMPWQTKALFRTKGQVRFYLTRKEILELFLWLLPFPLSVLVIAGIQGDLQGIVEAKAPVIVMLYV